MPGQARSCILPLFGEEEQGKEAQGQQQQLLPQQGGACLEEAGLSQAAEVQEPLLRGAVTLGTSTTL